MFVEDTSKAIDLICIDDAQDADPRKLARLIRTITSSSTIGRRFVIDRRANLGVDLDVSLIVAHIPVEDMPTEFSLVVSKERKVIP